MNTSAQQSEWDIFDGNARSANPTTSAEQTNGFTIPQRNARILPHAVVGSVQFHSIVLRKAESWVAEK
jgi:hypothetical protein